MDRKVGRDSVEPILPPTAVRAQRASPMNGNARLVFHSRSTKTTFVPAPIEILDLIARFEQHVDAYKAGQYNETQLRRDYHPRSPPPTPKSTASCMTSTA